jgi:hypothetical protein
LVYNLTSLPSPSINFLSLFNSALNKIEFSCKYPLMCVHTSHQPYGYPPFTLCSCQWAHKNPWCSLQHFYYHCVGCWLLDGVNITTRTSFKHVQLFLSMNQHYAHQRWHSHPSCRCCCDPMQADLLSQSYTTQGFDAYNVFQVT